MQDESDSMSKESSDVSGENKHAHVYHSRDRDELESDDDSY